ncbi:hypothetical protein JOE30_003819 [Rhodococcus sp. PvP016]|uniref:Uncharacterized protein n=1 Tax=Rhodococcoides corynebacterioides TaxID=53972 RepID=A0ABS2KUD5_9NOCA|nr:hypothetical protein [Rhodococcus corynebacterioides]MBP1118022.1 hypothetical protein [Rhodococcus sp. PvP016]
MNAQRPPRQPLTELVLIGIGAVLFALARLLDLDALFIGSIFLCMFAGLAALSSRKLGSRACG